MKTVSLRLQFRHIILLGIYTSKGQIKLSFNKHKFIYTHKNEKKERKKVSLFNYKLIYSVFNESLRMLSMNWYDVCSLSLWFWLTIEVRPMVPGTSNCLLNIETVWEPPFAMEVGAGGSKERS